MSSYDVIVVGAGGSGAPLAARLSEDPDRTVLLLEAGPAPRSVDAFPRELLDAGSLRGAEPRHPDNWSFPAHLTPDRPYSIARGRILGGSTTINGAYFIRAPDDDFERWSADGCDEWTPEKVLPLYRRLESDSEYGTTTRHGGSGPMRITRQSSAHPASAAFHAAAIELGYPDEPDKNGGGAPGVGPVPTNIVDEIRLNTGLAYLEPIAGRANLTIRGDATVRRVLFEGTDASGVEVERDGALEVDRGREIVLCAGAVKSPHLLMLSGIGPRRELEAYGIAVIVDAPRVGKGFSDHPQITLEWHPRPDFDRSGSIFGEVLNLVADDAAVEILQMLKPTEYLLTGSSPARAPLSFLVSLQEEESRGDLSLASSDPAVAPAIEYHYLSTAADRARMRSAVRLGVRMLDTAAFAPLVDHRDGPDQATVADDALLDAWILLHLGTSIHACGSAAFGSGDDTVVDQYGRVRGVSGLRVADTSILPTTPTRGPAATAVLIGELVSDFIWNGT